MNAAQKAKHTTQLNGLRSNQLGISTKEVIITAMQAIDNSISILFYINRILILKSHWRGMVAHPRKVVQLNQTSYLDS